MFWFFGHKACGILAPDQEWTAPRCVGKQGPSYWTAKEVPNTTFDSSFYLELYIFHYKYIFFIILKIALLFDAWNTKSIDYKIKCKS